MSPKKDNADAQAEAAYILFVSAEIEQRRLTFDEICQETGYSLRTFSAYRGKKYHWFLHGNKRAGYTVQGLYPRTPKDYFIGMHSQKSQPPPDPPAPQIVKDVVPVYYPVREIVEVEKSVDRFLCIEPNSVEMWLAIIGVILAGIWWR